MPGVKPGCPVSAELTAGLQMGNVLIVTCPYNCWPYVADLYEGVESMSDKKSWDEIPSLDGLGVDWDYKPNNPLGKRAFVRVQKGDLHTLFEARQIMVRVADGRVDTKGTLNDISEGGISVNLRNKLTVGLLVNVGLFLGSQKVISKAEVRRVEEAEGMFKTGMAFVDLSGEAKKYIAGVYAAMVLNNA